VANGSSITQESSPHNQINNNGSISAILSNFKKVWH